jgi:hypothetical protein
VIDDVAQAVKWLALLLTVVTLAIVATVAWSARSSGYVAGAEAQRLADSITFTRAQLQRDRAARIQTAAAVARGDSIDAALRASQAQTRELEAANRRRLAIENANTVRVDGVLVPTNPVIVDQLRLAGAVHTLDSLALVSCAGRIRTRDADRLALADVVVDLEHLDTLQTDRGQALERDVVAAEHRGFRRGVKATLTAGGAVAIIAASLRFIF